VLVRVGSGIVEAREEVTIVVETRVQARAATIVVTFRNLESRVGLKGV
jgi:hypothetical protein